MIHVVTITQANGRVRIIPVDADDTIDAVVRAARFLPFVTVGWTAIAEAQSDADCIEHAELFEKLVTEAHLDLCHESDKNGYVSDEVFDAGVNEYNRAYEALFTICNDDAEETRRDEKCSCYGQHEDIEN